MTWRGGLLIDAHYDEFVMMVKLPAQAGKQWIPVVQTCEKGVNEWTQIPAEGKTRKDLKSLAAELEITAGVAAALDVKEIEHKH